MAKLQQLLFELIDTDDHVEIAKMDEGVYYNPTTSNMFFNSKDMGYAFIWNMPKEQMQQFAKQLDMTPGKITLNEPSPSFLGIDPRDVERFIAAAVHGYDKQ